MKPLNFYAGRNLNQNHNHDLNLYTLQLICYRRKRTWPSGCNSAFRQSARALSKVILHANKLALQTKSNLVRKISLLACTLGLKAGQARNERDDKISCIKNPTVTQILARLLMHLPNPKDIIATSKRPITNSML